MRKSIPRVCEILLPIISWPQLCEGCECYVPNDDVDRECEIENLCYEIEKKEII